MIRNFVAFFFECLNDEPSIDQIFQRQFSRFLQLVSQLLAGVLRTQQLFPWCRQNAHLRVRDDVAVHNRSDAVNDLGLLGKRRPTNRQWRQAKNRQQDDGKQTHHVSHSFLISSRISLRCCLILAPTKRGNLPATSIKSPRRVNINLRSRTSTRFIPDFAPASLISMRPNKLSTAAGNGPKRSRQSRPRRCNCSCVVTSATLRYARMRKLGSLT